MSAQPDRPRSQPENRVVYLPVQVTYEGLADDTNGPYFKGQVQISPAYGPQTWSISESQVTTLDQIEARVSERIAQQLEEYGRETHPPHGRNPCLRCDIHAAYNNAAAIVRQNKKGNS